METTPIAEEVAKHWGISLLKRLDAQYADVFAGYDPNNHRPVILKIIPSLKDYGRETLMLTAYNTHRLYPHLFHCDTEKQYLLMECAKPGIPLTNYFPERDEEAVEVVCTLMQKLHQSPLPRNGEAPFLRDWLATLDKPWPVPPQYLEKARQFRDWLLSTPTKTVLLHGDLHHSNILRHGNGWMVIDPKGVVGDALYETAVFLCNPMPKLLENHDTSHLIHRRIQHAANLLNAEEKRVMGWGFVHAVMAWCWCVEDGKDPAYFKGISEVLDKISNLR